jgi:ribosomal protein L11 methyltransferase
VVSVPALDVHYSTESHPSSADEVVVADLLLAALTDFAVTAIDEGASGLGSWRVYFADAPERALANIHLETVFATSAVTFSPIEVFDEGWAEKSQANLKAIRVGRVVVAPPWDQPANLKADNDLVIIVILPSMGFGTGHHPTTRLCLHALQALSLDGASVIDVGTGSGVLAITAKRLGASQVLGIDDDADAIAAARDSLALNPGVDITLGIFDLRQSHLRQVDVVFANLTGSLLVATAAILGSLGRCLVISGFQPDEREAVLAAYASWTIEREESEGGWCCATLVRTTAQPLAATRF